MDISPSITPNMLDIDLEDPSRPHTGSVDRPLFLSRVWHEVREPLLRFIVLWLLLSCVAAVVGFIDEVALRYALLVGSLLSICGTALVLFSGYMGNSRHREAFQFIYFVAICDLLFGLLLAFDAIMSLAGFSLTWKEQNDAYCLSIGIAGQIFAMSSMGYTFVVMLDLLLVVCASDYSRIGCDNVFLVSPMHYTRRTKQSVIPKYHFAVWFIAIACNFTLIAILDSHDVACVPAVAVNRVGMYDNETCWLVGDYIWFFWSFWYAFMLFAVVGVVSLVRRLNRHSQQTETVVKQSSLIVCSFFLAWIWNIILDSIIAAHHVVPQWLLAVQLFWLGGIGFCNAIVWMPFIRKALTRMHSIRHLKRVYVSPPKQHVIVESTITFNMRHIDATNAITLHANVITHGTP